MLVIVQHNRFGGPVEPTFQRDNLRTEVTGSDLDDLDDDYYDTSDDDDDDGEANIDDGLLDAVFDELPGTGQTRPPPPPPSRPSPPSSPSCPTCPPFTQSQGGGFYYCIMGGQHYISIH